MMEVESSDCPESEENKDGSENKETVNTCGGDRENESEENKDDSENKETVNTCGGDCENESEENKDGSENKETVNICGGDRENESEENKDGSENKETVNTCGGDRENESEENKDNSENKETVNTCGGDRENESEENKDDSENKETVNTCGGDCENEVKEIGSSSNEESQTSDGQKPEETENTEAFVEEGGDGESEPEFFNMEDFEVVDVVDDEGDDRGVQCKSSSQISDNREKDTGKTRSKHGQSQKSGSSKSRKHQGKRDRSHNPKDVSRSNREGKRSSSGSSRSHVRARSKEKSRKASSKDRISCDLARGLSEKSSDKQKSSRTSRKEDNRKAVEKDKCSSHKSDHKKRDRHHSDNKRIDDKSTSSKKRESDHRKRESRRPDDRQVHSDKINERKSCRQDQQNSNKRGSDKYKSDKRMKDKENSNKKNAAKRKQNEDTEKTENENDIPKELNKGISDNEETSVGYAKVSASCEFTSTVCETSSVSCVTSSASFERKCTNSETTCEMASASFDKTIATCEIPCTSCELTSNEEHEMIAGNIVEEPKKNEIKPNCRCKNNSSKAKATSDMPPEKATSEEDLGGEAEQGTKNSEQKDQKFEKTSEEFETEDLEPKPAADSSKQEDYKCEQTPQVSKNKNLEPKQAMDDSEHDPKFEQTTKNSKKEVPASEQGTEHSEQEDPKSKQTANELRQENPKFKLATKNIQEDPKFNQTAKDSNQNECKSLTEDSKQKDTKVEQVAKDREQKDLKSGQKAEDSKQEDSESEQAAEVFEQLNPKAEEGVKDSKLKDCRCKKANADSKQENIKSRPSSESSKKKSSISNEDLVSEQKTGKSKQVAEDCEKGDVKLKQEIDHSEMKNMKLKQEKNFEKEEIDCKQETDDVKKEGVPKEEGGSEVVTNKNAGESKGALLQNESDHHLQPEQYVLDLKAGQTEDKTTTGSKETSISDEIKAQIIKYIERIRKEVDEKEAKEVDSVSKKVIGKPSSYKFSKVIVIGDSRIKHLDSTYLKKTFDNLEIKCVPCLTIDNLQEVFDQHVIKRKYPQGILLICSVGIYNIIGFCSNISCKKDHKSMEQVYIKSSLARPVIGKMRAMKIKLKKMLGKDSEVLFTTILPVNVMKFITYQVKIHSETTGHTPVVRSDWSDLENTVHNVIDSINREVIKFSTRKDGKRIPWDLIHFSGSLECQNKLTEQYLENGLDPSKDVTLTQLVPRFQFTLKQYSMNRYQQVVLIGDSRTEIVANNWPRCKRPPVFTILTQSRLCFRDLSEENAVVKEIMGMKDSLIVISLGMYDFIKYITLDGCESHEQLEIPCLYHEKADNEEWDDFIHSLKKADQLLHKITSNCDVIITTVYSFDYHFLKNFEIQKHATATGHVVKSGLESKALYEKIDKIKEFLKRINRIAIKLAQEKQLPVWDLGGLVHNLSEAHTKDALTLFDGAHPSSELANRMGKACISYAEASLCLCCPDSIPHDVKDVSDLDNRLFTRVGSISSLLEINDFTLPLSEFHDEKERKEDSVHSQDSDNKRCKSNKNLISVNLHSPSLKGTLDLNESEIRKSRVSKQNEGGGSEKKHVTEITSPSSTSTTQSNDVNSGRKSTAGKQESIAKGCSSSKSPFRESVSPASRGSSPSANVSPFSDISCTSSKISYLENISPSSMNVIPSPYSERKYTEIDEKRSSQDRNHSPTVSCGSVRHSSQERSHHSFKFSRFSRSPYGHFGSARRSSLDRCYSPVRTYSLERSDSHKRKRSHSREHSSNRSRSPARCHSPARYRRRGRYFSPETNYSEKNDFSPARSLSWARYHSPERNYSVDREDTYNINRNYRSRSPVRHSSKERHYSQERGYRNRSPRSYTPVGSDRSRELYDSRKNEWQYSPDRHVSPTRGHYNSHTLGTSRWESDSGQQENRSSHNGQHSPFRRDENSRRSRSRLRCQSRKKKRPASKSKKSITMRALESLREVHVRECDMYRQNPAAHPDYNKEYWAFVDKKAQNILSLGGDPYTYDMSKDWEMFWPNRLQEIFNEGWEFKRDQCISMLIANRGRSRSPSSISSCSSVSSSQSSDISNYSRRYHKKRAKYSKSPSEDRERRVEERCRSRENIRKSDRNKDSGSHYRDKGELKQEQKSDIHRVRDRERDRRDRKDDHLEAKLPVSETVQEHNLQGGGRRTTKDLKKKKGIFTEALNNVNEHVHPGRVSAQEVNVAPMAALGAPLTSKEADVTGQSDVRTKVSKVERNLVKSNDSRKGKTCFSSGKENPNDAVGFKNKHSCVTAPPVGLEDLVCKSVEKAQKVDDLTLHKTKQSSEEEVSSTTPVEEGAKTDVIDVLEILSRLGERLGALLVPVQLLHQKAVELKSSGLDTMKIFDEIDNKILLHMTGDKLRTALKGDDIPIIQKVIIQEGEQRLRLLLEKEKDRSLLFDLNIDNIATACLGKTSADTITFIENALLYHGYTEVPKDQLKKIYMAVKKEQVRVMDLEQPGNPVRQGSLPRSRHSRAAPSSSMPPQPSGSAPYSPSQISVSSEDSLPSLPAPPHSIPHATQIIPQPVPSPFLNTTDCSQSPGGVRGDVVRGESTVSETTAVGSVAHTTHAELHWKSDLGALESKTNTDASSSVSVTYECRSKVSLTCDSKAAVMPSNYQSSRGVSAAHSVIPNKSHHVQKSESRRSTSKGSSKKPIKILLPKPRAPRVFVRAFNPLGEDESESEDS